MKEGQVEVKYLVKKLREIREEKKHTLSDEERKKIEGIEKNLVFELGKRISKHPALKAAIRHSREIADLINPQDTSRHPMLF